MTTLMGLNFTGIKIHGLTLPRFLTISRRFSFADGQLSGFLQIWQPENENKQSTKTDTVDMRDINDTHREKAPSNKTPTLSKIKNMDIWVVGTSNQLFIRGF